MKSGTVIKAQKNSRSTLSGKRKTDTTANKKTDKRNIFSKTPSKISASTQFKQIKNALKEVELIEAGIMKPASLEDVLNEL